MKSVKYYTIGSRVQVFNQIGSNWFGVIAAINKRTARVISQSDISTHHPESRKEYNDGYHYLVPFGDILHPMQTLSACIAKINELETK